MQALHPDAHPHQDPELKRLREESHEEWTRVVKEVTDFFFNEALACKGCHKTHTKGCTAFHQAVLERYQKLYDVLSFQVLPITDRVTNELVEELEVIKRGADGAEEEARKEGEWKCDETRERIL